MTYLDITWRGVRWELHYLAEENAERAMIEGLIHACWVDNGLALDARDVVAILRSAEDDELERVFHYHTKKGHTCSRQVSCETPSTLAIGTATTQGTNGTHSP